MQITKHSEHRLILGDCLEEMEGIDDRSVDLVLCDLPYGSTGNKWDSMIPLAQLWRLYRAIRVSYLTQEGNQPTIESDLALYDRLVGSVPLHASPAEHQATPDVGMLFESTGRVDWDNSHLHGNLLGWVQYRKLLETRRALEPGMDLVALGPRPALRGGE